MLFDTPVSHAIIQALIVPVVARWSDRIGRRPIYAIAAVGNLVLLLQAFALMQVGQVWSLYLALFMVSLPSAFFLSLTGAAMSELFPTASRYGGVGLTHDVAISLFGGTTPLVRQILPAEPAQAESVGAGTRRPIISCPSTGAYDDGHFRQEVAVVLR